MLRMLLLALPLIFSSALAESRQMVLTVPGAELHATLQTQEGVVFPAMALILAGSGPTDPDGNSPRTGRLGRQ